MNWLERISFFIPRRAIRMIFLGLYRSVTSLTGHPAVQVPQEKHFFIFTPPGSEAMRNLKLESRVLESIIEFQIPFTRTQIPNNVRSSKSNQHVSRNG